MKRLIVIAAVLALVVTPAQAQSVEPDSVFSIGHCTAIFDVHTLAIFRQIDRQTGDGMYDLPRLAPAGAVVRIDARWDDTLVLVWHEGLAGVTLRKLLCGGSPGWQHWLPVIVQRGMQ